MYHINKSSSGELLVQGILKTLKLSFIKEHQFKDCKNPSTNQKLKFDFYLPKNNLCIEIDGIQHYEYIEDFYGTDKEIGLNKFHNQIIKDEIKSEYCLNNNIKLLRISYKDLNSILNIKKLIQTLL